MTPKNEWEIFIYNRTFTLEKNQKPAQNDHIWKVVVL